MTVPVPGLRSPGSQESGRLLSPFVFGPLTRAGEVSGSRKCL
jgi:hypothetical protein